MAAGRQDSAGYGGRLEEEVQNGHGNSTAGSSIALQGRVTGAGNGRSEGGIYHSAGGRIPRLNKTSFACRKLIYVDEIARSYV